MGTTSVAIFIPHHRGILHLAPLFDSLYEMDTRGYTVRLVLIDNASSDGSVGFVRQRYPGVIIESRPVNEGFAPAINHAVRHAFEDWLIFLNNDVRVAPDWLQVLLGHAESRGNVCVASRLVDWDGRFTQFAGGTVNASGKGFEYTEVQSDEPFEIFFPCGCGMAIRRQRFCEVGGFDSRYFMIYEDVDLGWRLRVLGDRIYLVPGARVYHRAHASLSAESYATKAVYLERNSLATLYKNLEAPTWVRLMPLLHQEALLRSRALGGWRIPVRYRSDGVAGLDGLLAFQNELPHWRSQREWIQQHRTIPDADILPRWIPEPTRPWAYAESRYPRLEHPDLQPEWETLRNRILDVFSSIGPSRNAQ